MDNFFPPHTRKFQPELAAYIKALRHLYSIRQDTWEPDTPQVAEARSKADQLYSKLSEEERRQVDLMSNSGYLFRTLGVQQ